jgi:hypothetical protein
MPSFYIVQHNGRWHLYGGLNTPVGERKAYWLPDDMRAFDAVEGFRKGSQSFSLLYIDNDIQLLVAVDYLLERDWEIDFRLCCEDFKQLYWSGVAA